MPRFLDDIVNAAAEGLGELEALVHGPLYPIRYYSADVDGRLVRGAWPDSEQLRALAARGVEACINLCAERDQDAEVLAAGMLPANVRVRDGSTLDRDLLELALELIRGHRRTYVHCEAGVGRTGQLVAGYRVLEQGWPSAAALDEAQHYGHLTPAQERWILELDGSAPPLEPYIDGPEPSTQDTIEAGRALGNQGGR